MKTLHLFEAYLPQTENWAYNLISNLPDTEIHVAANHYLKNNFYHSNFHFCENYYDGLRYYDFSLNRKKGLLKKLLIKTIPYFLGHPHQNIIAYAQTEGMELVHAHFADVAWRFRSIPQKLNIPFVVSFYGWDYEMLPYTQPIFKKYYKKLFKTVDKFICEGTHGAKILAEMGCPNHKIEVIRLGVQTQHIPFFKREKHEAGLKLLQVASFNQKKGHIYTVQAFLTALKTCPNMTLTLVGKDAGNGIKQQIQEQIKKSGQAHKITIIDGIDFSKLHQFFEDYHVFIHPSCYADNRDCEGGAPVVLLDAQATGMPIIATRHCDIPDEVIHGKTGFLAAEKNVDELVEYIEYFYKMPQETYHISAKAAKNHVKKAFNIEDSAIKLKQLYTNLIKK